MPEQFYKERALLGSDGLSSGTPPGDARCYALRAFSFAPDDETRVKVICGEFWDKRVYLRFLSR